MGHRVQVGPGHGSAGRDVISFGLNEKFLISIAKAPVADLPPAFEASAAPASASLFPACSQPRVGVDCPCLPGTEPAPPSVLPRGSGVGTSQVEISTMFG